MEITVETITDLFVKHNAIPRTTVFYRQYDAQPVCCLLGILDVEKHGQPRNGAVGEQRISTYVTRVALDYGLAENFVLGLMYGWDWYDYSSVVLNNLSGKFDIDPDGFALGQRIGRALMSEETQSWS